MKLYEFTYTDKQKLPENELLGRVESFLQKESENQGWAAGYQFRRCKDVERTSTGEINYTFEVIGRYLDTENLESDTDLSLSTPSSKTPIAAKDADI